MVKLPLPLTSCSNWKNGCCTLPGQHNRVWPDGVVGESRTEGQGNCPCPLLISAKGLTSQDGTGELTLVVGAGENCRADQLHNYTGPEPGLCMS